MELLLFPRRLGAFWLFIAIGGLSLPTIHAQTPTPYQIVIQEAANDNELYEFSTTGLSLNDRVFYRFSDGHHLEAQKTGTNLSATVSRRFPNTSSGPPTVIGYVTKKNGPLGIAYPPEDLEIQTCTACNPPTFGLAPNEFIRLSNSWDLFSNTQAAVPFTDITTIPAFTAPNTPWFLLTVTMRAPTGASHANVTFPSGLSFEGAIVENKWGTGTTVANTFIQSIEAISNQTVRIKLDPNISSPPFKVYLLMRGNPNSNDNLFAANVYDERNKPLGGNNELRLVTKQWPHDPNSLTRSNEVICKVSTKNPPLLHRVDFMNEGQGPADHVVVKVEIDPEVLDPATVSDIVTSANYTNPVIFSYGADYVKFNLLGINLPGIAQIPQPSAEQTSGWIQFFIRTKDCLNPESATYFTRGFITFISELEGKPVFQETMQTNTTEHKLNSNCPPDPLCLKPPDGRSNKAGILQSPACYPTLFTDRLTLEAPAAPENGMVRIAINDIAGKRWLEISHPVSSGEVFWQQIETAHLPNGMYLVHFQQGRRTTVFKIVKTKI